VKVLLLPAVGSIRHDPIKSPKRGGVTVLGSGWVRAAADRPTNRRGGGGARCICAGERHAVSVCVIASKCDAVS
jgi:hypothetical protein